MSNYPRKLALLISLALVSIQGIAEDQISDKTLDQKRVSISVRDTSIQEVLELLSKKDQVNILIGKNVSGNVSVNLYQVTLEEAIKAIAIAAGYVVEHSNDTYMILDRKPLCL